MISALKPVPDRGRKIYGRSVSVLKKRRQKGFFSAVTKLRKSLARSKQKKNIMGVIALKDLSVKSKNIK